MQDLIAKVVRNTLSSIALRMVTIVLSLVAIPVLINAIGATGYGLVLLAGTISGYLALLGAGVPAGTTKFVAEDLARGDQEGLHRVIDTSLVFFTGVGLAAGALLALFVAAGGLSIFEVEPGFEDQAVTVLYVAAGLAPLLWPANALSATLEGLQRHHERNIASGVTTLLMHAGAITVALAGFGTVWVFVAQQTAVLLRVVWYFRIVRRYAPGWKPMASGFHRPTFRKILSLSLWLLLAQLAVLLHYQADHFILSGFIAVGAIATYTVVMRPFHFIKEMVAFFNAAIMPAVSAVEVTDGEDGVHRIAYTGSRYSNAFGAPFAVIGIILCGPFLGLWIGPEMLEYAWLAQIACATRLVAQTNGLVGQVFNGTGRVQRPALIASFVAVVNVGLSIWWVNLWGISGVVLATVVAFSMAVPLQYLFVFPQLSLDRMRFLKESVLRPVAPHLLLGAALAPLWSHFQSIDSWASLLLHSVLLSLVFFPFTWLAIERDHRRWFVDKVTRKLRGRKPPQPTTT